MCVCVCVCVLIPRGKSCRCSQMRLVNGHIIADGSALLSPSLPPMFAQVTLGKNALLDTLFDDSSTTGAMEIVGGPAPAKDMGVCIYIYIYIYAYILYISVCWSTHLYAYISHPVPVNSPCTSERKTWIGVCMYTYLHPSVRSYIYHVCILCNGCRWHTTVECTALWMVAFTSVQETPPVRRALTRSPKAGKPLATHFLRPSSCKPANGVPPLSPRWTTVFTLFL